MSSWSTLRLRLTSEQPEFYLDPVCLTELKATVIAVSDHKTVK